MKPKGGYVYIVSNPYRTVLYIGVTSNLYKRAYEHKNAMGSDFTEKYNCTDLVYFEFYDRIESAIIKEKQLKYWKREWKINLIKKQNPDMRDLFDEVADFQ
ncbi:MAG: GIY-YIG nuclease family protein [Chitinophagales bacterium]